MRLRIAGVLVLMVAGLSCGTVQQSPSTELASRTSPVQVGETAPDFTLEDQNGQKVTLSSSRGAAPTILVFYRGHW